MRTVIGQASCCIYSSNQLQRYNKIDISYLYMQPCNVIYHIPYIHPQTVNFHIYMYIFVLKCAPYGKTFPNTKNQLTSFNLTICQPMSISHETALSWGIYEFRFYKGYIHKQAILDQCISKVPKHQNPILNVAVDHTNISSCFHTNLVQ